MSEALQKIQSMIGETERIKKPYEPRRSLFEDPNKTKQEKDKNNAFLDEWNGRWGKYNLDYVYTVQYPEEYKQTLKMRKEFFLNGFTELMKRSSELLELLEDCILIFTEEILKADQSTTLQYMHSKIIKYFTDATLFLKDLEVFKETQQIDLNKIENEIKTFNTFNS